jgi:hypothetical protein
MRHRSLPLNTLRLKEPRTFQFQKADEPTQKKKLHQTFLLQFGKLGTCQLLFEWDSVHDNRIYLGLCTLTYKEQLNYSK